MRPYYRVCCFFAASSMLVISIFVFSVSCQEIEFASSPNPVGSGARSLGMGGAFIAVADDATAASWNPGGLIQLEHPELSIVGAGFYRSEDNSFGGHTEADGSQSVTEGNLNYLSGVYPFTLKGLNMVVALTYQHLYDFNRSWKFHYSADSESLFIDRSVDYRQEGSLSAVGISYALQATPTLSLGMTVNIWDEGIGSNWKQNTSYTAVGTLGTSSVSERYNKLDKYSFNGLNCNIGLLWRVTEALTFGLVYKAPFAADIKHKNSLDQRIEVNNSTQPPLWEASIQNTFDEELEMPASYGIGIAYRFSDQLTTSFDLYRTEWDDMIYKDYLGNRTSAISGVEENNSEIDNTIQVRAGIEYLIIKTTYLIPVRAGIFYDPAPSEQGSDDFYGFSLGSGFTMDKYIFDVGYQLRYGRDVGSVIFKSGELSQDVQEHTLYASLILHF